MSNYKIRFHLGRGPNYMSWQVARYGSLFYFDPNKVQLILYDCFLYNNINIANKIFEGKNKTVCAWIQCKEFELNPYFLMVDTKNLKNIQYNPRTLPFWSMDGENIDKRSFRCLVTNQNKVYLNEKFG